MGSLQSSRMLQTKIDRKINKIKSRITDKHIVFFSALIVSQCFLWLCGSRVCFEAFDIYVMIGCTMMLMLIPMVIYIVVNRKKKKNKRIKLEGEKNE